MWRNIAIFIVLFITTLFANCSFSQDVQAIQWQSYSNAVFDQAKQTKRFILLYGKSKACHWCQEMDKTTWKTPAIIRAIQAGFIPVLIDVDTQLNIAKQYRMTSLPAVIILDSDNHSLKNFSGYFAPDVMEKNLKEIPAYREHSVQNNQPEAIKTILPKELYETLKKKQLDFFNSNNNALDLDSIEYAMTLSAEREQATHSWIAKLLKSQSGLFDHLTPAKQAEALRVYSQAYVYWPESAYISMAEKLINALKMNQHIDAQEDGLIITGLVYFYMTKGDVTALEEAIKMANGAVDNLSVMGGGFRHTKTENNIIYLNDNLAMGYAFLTLYKATMNLEYLNRAVKIAQFINKYFQNPKGNSGFISTLELSKVDEEVKLNAKENADIVRFTSLLFHYTGEEFLQKMQLDAFHYVMTPDVIAKNSPALVLMAEYRISNHPLHIAVVGAKDDPEAKDLYKTALAFSTVYARIDWWDRKEGPLLNSDAAYPITNKAAAYVCHDSQCSFPIYKPHDLQTIMHDVLSPAPLPSVIGDSLSAENLLAQKNWFLILFGFIGFGMLLSFTPCILPLIPIMASIIVGQTIGVRKGKTFSLCLIYVLSMSLTYACLGILAGVFGVYLQIYMQTPWVVALFSLIFLTLALSMLGAFELKIPSVIQQKINAWSNLQKGGTYLGVLGMGVLATLIISPCVTAPLAGALSFIAKTGDYLLGAVGLFCMGFGMGMPLLIISISSNNILPRVAHWNNQIKTMTGIVLLGVSIWIASRIISNVLTMILWSALIIFVTICMGFTKRKTKDLFQKCWKTATIMLFVYGVALFFNALFVSSDLYQTMIKNQKLLSTNQGTSISLVFKNIKNNADLEQAIHEAKENALPIMLDFSAKWCASCVSIERHVFNDEKVTSMLSKFLLLRVDLTEVNSENMALARQFNVVAPPIILFFDEETGKRMDVRVTGNINAEQFYQVLQQAINIGHSPQS